MIIHKKNVSLWADMENQYIKQFPELMAGKTVLYVHGFASSGQSGTVARIRQVLPHAHVVAPDIPVHPEEALPLLHSICEKEQPSLIIGTSMGGMYTEQLYGYDRICINPALCIADTMQAHGMTGTQTFQNPRQDGVQQFYVDKAMVKEYRQVSELRFSGINDEERRRVYGVFGDKDDLVDTFDMFHEQYPLATHFHGEHRMDDRSFMHAVLPVIRWIDDQQEKRERPIIYIGVETASPVSSKGGGNGDRGHRTWGGLTMDRKPASSFQKAVRELTEHYQVFFVAPTEGYAETTTWLEEYVNVPAWRHTIFTDRRSLLLGDYLIEQEETKDTMATRLEFGSDTFKTWEDLLEYFSHLGGQ